VGCEGSKGWASRMMAFAPDDGARTAYSSMRPGRWAWVAVPVHWRDATAPMTTRWFLVRRSGRVAAAAEMLWREHDDYSGEVPHDGEFQLPAHFAWFIPACFRFGAGTVVGIIPCTGSRAGVAAFPRHIGCPDCAYTKRSCE